MSIGSVNNSNSAMLLGGMNNMRRPDSSKMAEALFSKLDTAGKGYIEKGDLESALGKISGNSSSSSGSSASTDDMFSKLDSNGDGKVSGSEARAFEESKNSSGTGNTGTDTSSSSVSRADAQFMKQMMQLIHAYGGFDHEAENNRFSTSA